MPAGGRRYAFGFLQLRTLNGVLTAAERRSTAHEWHFFNDNDVGAMIGTVDGRTHTGGTTADDDDVGRNVLRRNGLGFLCGGFQCFRIAACLAHAIGDGCQEGFTRKRGAGHLVYFERLF